MKILFKTNNPNEIWPLLGRMVKDENVLSDDGENLCGCLIMPFNMYAIPDSDDFKGALYFEEIKPLYLRCVYRLVSIAKLVERIRV